MVTPPRPEQIPQTLAEPATDAGYPPEPAAHRAELLEKLYRFVWHEMGSADPEPHYPGYTLIKDADMARIEELCAAIEQAENPQPGLPVGVHQDGTICWHPPLEDTPFGLKCAAGRSVTQRGMAAT